MLKNISLGFGWLGILKEHVELLFELHEIAVVYQFLNQWISCLIKKINSSLINNQIICNISVD